MAEEKVSSRGAVRETGKENDEDEDMPSADWDVHGDTDTEGVLSEVPVTPSSSFGLGDLSVVDDDDENDRGDGKDALMTMQKDEVMTKDVEVVHSSADSDLMDVAYVLCGLRQRS